jgi:tryptophan 2,3-dioxygenase
MLDANDRIIKKYQELGENPETYLEVLLHAKPIIY